MNKNEKWVTNLIGKEYLNWQSGIYALSIGTGVGKTTFVIERIIPYAKFIKKKVLYLCNREPLLSQNETDMKGFSDTVTIMTYQKLQSDLSRSRDIGHYDYVICDEAHYFFSDAPFNPATDVAFDYVIEQRECSVVILMSATASKLFNYLVEEGMLEPDRIFTLAQEYSYVDNVFLYDGRSFFTLIDNILERDDSAKIIAFVNEKRLVSAHKYYGKTAEYMCSRHTRSDKLKRICGIGEEEIITKSGHSRKERTAPQIIKDLGDGVRSFEKRLLFTTKVLDNGVSLIDRDITAVFCELLDQDSLLQALGRKRSQGDNDRCSFYIKNYQANWIQGKINQYEKWMRQADTLRFHKEVFTEVYEDPKLRDTLKINKILYADSDGWHVNMMRYQRYRAELLIMQKMLDQGYLSVLRDTLGEALSAKLVQDYTEPVYRDELKDYLSAIHPDEKLYKDEQTKIKEMFKGIGLNLGKISLKGKRSQGIAALNGVLESRYGNTYKPRFTNKDAEGKPLIDKRRKREDGEENPNRNKHYWLLQPP